MALNALAFGHELLFCGFEVNEYDICITTAANVECPARAQRSHAHSNAGFLLEDWEDVSEQAGLLGRRGGGDRDEVVLCLRTTDDASDEQSK